MGRGANTRGPEMPVCVKKHLPKLAEKLFVFSRIVNGKTYVFKRKPERDETDILLINGKGTSDGIGVTTVCPAFGKSISVSGRTGQRIGYSSVAITTASA